jgi:hypothetical protein
MKHAVVLLIAVLLLAFSAFAADGNKPLNVIYIAGPGEFSEGKVDLLITGQTLAINAKSRGKKHAYYVPLGEVTLMTHSPVRFNRAGQVSRNVPNLNPPRMSGGNDPISNAVNLLMLMSWGAYETGRYSAVGIGATQHGQRHFITIDWQEQGIERELLVEAPKDNYAELIRQLEAASGKKVFDFEARWLQVHEELKREKDHAIPVVLAKRVKLENLSFAPGAYSIIAIPREKDLAELYFFEGKLIDSTSLRGVAIVTTAAAIDSSMKEVEIDYTTTVPAEIQEIRTPTKTFRMVTSATQQKMQQK